MLVIGLNGSPKKKGNTAVLLTKVLETAVSLGAETKTINVQDVLSSVETPFCIACSSPCLGRCYRGTELEEALALIGEADALVLGSPVYFGTVSAQLKSFWDRTRRLRTEQLLRNTVGAAVSVGGARFGGQETTIKALYDMMIIQGMVIVGDNNRAAPGHHGVCAQKPSASDKNALKRAAILGECIVEAAAATRGLRKKNGA